MDSDKDGHNNWQEWRCLTDPTNALSVLRMVSATPSGTNVLVSWQSVAGVTYHLLRSTNLCAWPPFQLLDYYLVGEAGTTEYTDLEAARTVLSAPSGETPPPGPVAGPGAGYRYRTVGGIARGGMGAIHSLVSNADGVDPLVKRRAEFFTRMLTDAFSPSNFLASNPAALRELMYSKGESLLRGMQQFAADMERGGGQLAISQTDYSRFKVGENVATATGEVVWRGELYELIQYAPTKSRSTSSPSSSFPRGSTSSTSSTCARRIR